MNLQEIDQTITKNQQNSLLETSTTKPPSIWYSKRFLVVFLMFLCYTNTAFVRHNISIALVEMTSPKMIKIDNFTETRPADFNWDSKTIGLVLSMFYYGGLVSVIGGYVINKLGGATSCTLCMLISGITTVLHPISLDYGFNTFLAVRFLTGAFENFVTISILEVCSKWIPKNERSKLMSFVSIGLRVGAGVVYSFCGYLGYRWGWQMIFYGTGTISLVLSFLCFSLVKNKPSEDKWIRETELIYIELQQQQNVQPELSNETMAYSYRNILLSAPVWALLVVKFTHCWIVTIVVTFLPLYIKDITGDDTDKVGMYSSIPNIASIFLMPICGILMDYSRKFNISATMTYKILISGSFVLCGVLLSSVVMFSNFIASMIFFSLTLVSLSIVILVSHIIIISIAPNNSGLIAGIDLFVTSISSITLRSTTGYMTTNRSPQEWNNCFILAGVFSVLGAAIFGFCGSSEPQSWSRSPKVQDDHIQRNQQTRTS